MTPPKNVPKYYRFFNLDAPLSTMYSSCTATVNYMGSWVLGRQSVRSSCIRGALV